MFHWTSLGVKKVDLKRPVLNKGDTDIKCKLQHDVVQQYVWLEPGFIVLVEGNVYFCTMVPPISVH